MSKHPFSRWDAVVLALVAIAIVGSFLVSLKISVWLVGGK